jgi:hypothetical protein
MAIAKNDFVYRVAFNKEVAFKKGQTIPDSILNNPWVVQNSETLEAPDLSDLNLDVLDPLQQAPETLITPDPVDSLQPNPDPTPNSEAETKGVKYQELRPNPNRR